MAGHCPILDLSRSLGDHQLVGDELLAPLAHSRSGHPQGTTGPEACHELTLEAASALDVERLVDRFVADTHRLIVGEIDSKPCRDLLGAPCLGPPPICTTSVAASFERNIRARHRCPVGTFDLPRQSVLHILPEPVIGGQFRHLRTRCASFSVPLGSRCPVGQLVGSCRCVPAQFAADRRRRTAQTPGDLPYSNLLGVQ